MKRILGLLLLGCLLLLGAGAAEAQITGTYTCPSSITFSSGSATAATSTTCGVFETYVYGRSAASQPFASSLFIPAVPNSSASSTVYIAANLLADLASTQTFTGVKTFTNSTIDLLGSSTGYTTFTSANSGASNFTLTFPAATDTLADLAGTQTLSNKTLASPTLSGTVGGSGAIPNSVLVNSSTTVNGQTCTLGASCTATAAASGVDLAGATAVTNGVSGNVVIDNAGVLGGVATTGSGNFVRATSPTVSGLTVTSSFTATGLVGNSSLVAGNFPAITGVGTLGLLNVSGQITGNLSGASAPAAVIPGLQIVGASATATGIQENTYAAIPEYLGQRADGTPGSPTAVAAGDSLAALLGSGYNGSAYSGNVAGLYAEASQTFTTGAEGTRLSFFTTPNGTTTPAETMRLDQNGALLLPFSSTNPGTNGLGVTGPVNFANTLTLTGLGSGTIANSLCTTSAGLVVTSSATNCFSSAGTVTSVTGTAGQVTASPTTGAVVVSLPATITSSETASGEWQFTGGALVPPGSTPCGSSITPTPSTQNIECAVTAATTLNVPSPFVAGETYIVTLQEGATAFPISVAANIRVPGGGIANLQQAVANDRDKLICTTTVIGGNNSFDCGQLTQLRQPPAWHVGCNGGSATSVSSISCSFSGGYTPPVGSIVLVGFDAGSGTATSLYSSASFTGGSCVVPSVPANGFVYNSSFGIGYYLLSCQVTTGGATSIGVNFSSSVSFAGIFADVVANSFGLDASNMNTTATASSTPTSGTISPSQQDLVWGWLACGACGTVTAGSGFTLGQNVSGVGQTEYAILPAGGAPQAVFNAGTAAGYAAGALAVLP